LCTIYFSSFSAKLTRWPYGVSSALRQVQEGRRIPVSLFFYVAVHARPALVAVAGPRLVAGAVLAAGVGAAFVAEVALVPVATVALARSLNIKYALKPIVVCCVLRIVIYSAHLAHPEDWMTVFLAFWFVAKLSLPSLQALALEGTIAESVHAARKEAALGAVHSAVAHMAPGYSKFK
jgi:hypothetical protein